jgi:hypothetical protein
MVCIERIILYTGAHYDRRLAAFRIFRLLLKVNNANLHTQVMKLDVLKPILDLTLRESRRDNLLSCSCHEYFDYIRRVRAAPLYVRVPAHLFARRKT